MSHVSPEYSNDLTDGRDSPDVYAGVDAAVTQVCHNGTS